MKFKKYDNSVIIEAVQFNGTEKSIKRLQEFGGFTPKQCKVFRQSSDDIRIMLGDSPITGFFILQKSDWLVKMDNKLQTMCTFSNEIITAFYTEIKEE